MAPRWDADLKGRRRSKVYYEGDQKTKSEKWCSHPYHQGINKAKRNSGRLSETKFKSFPHADRHISAFIALSHNDAMVIKRLLREGKAGMRQNRCNCTLLQLAARNDRKEIISLLHNAVNPNAVNRYGQTASHIAALQGNTEMLKLLLSFDHFCPEMRDMWNNSYKDNLAAPLFTAVLWSDTDHIEELLKLGADPDGHAGKLVEGIVAQELKVSTPRELAIALNRKSIVDKFPKPTLPETWSSVPVISHRQKSQYISTTKGFVSIFSYDSFKGRPDLSNGTSENDANNLAKVFNDIGYNGDIYPSLSAEETLKALGDMRQMEMLADAESLIFYFTSHEVSVDGSEASFLTSDLRTLSISDILDSFSEFLCPSYLKNKTKIFIFDLCKLPEDKLNPRDFFDCKFANANKTIPFALRSQRRKEETICIYSSIPKESLQNDFTRDGSMYNKTLCKVLAEKGQAVTVSEVFDKVKSEMRKDGTQSESYLISYNYQGNFHLKDQ